MPASEGFLLEVKKKVKKLGAWGHLSQTLPMQHLHSVSLSASPMKRALQIHTCLQPGIATRGCALLLLSFPLTHEGLMSFGEGEKRN